MKDYILGVDLGGTNIKAAAYRLGSYEKVGRSACPPRWRAAGSTCWAGCWRPWTSCSGKRPGSGCSAWAWACPACRVVESHALAISRAGCEIVTAQLGDAAGMLGAAVYGARRMGEGARM